MRSWAGSRMTPSSWTGEEIITGIAGEVITSSWTGEGMLRHTRDKLVSKKWQSQPRLAHNPDGCHCACLLAASLLCVAAAAPCP